MPESSPSPKSHQLYRSLSGCLQTISTDDNRLVLRLSDGLVNHCTRCDVVVGVVVLGHNRCVVYYPAQSRPYCFTLMAFEPLGIVLVLTLGQGRSYLVTDPVLGISWVKVSSGP